MLFWLFGWKLLAVALAAAVGVVAALHRRSIRRGEGELAGDLELLARTQPGGEPSSAVVVPTAAVIESRVRSFECHACGAKALDVTHHSSGTFEELRLRVLRVACRDCGAERDVYVRIEAAN